MQERSLRESYICWAMGYIQVTIIKINNNNYQLIETIHILEQLVMKILVWASWNT